MVRTHYFSCGVYLHGKDPLEGERNMKAIKDHYDFILKLNRDHGLSQDGKKYTGPQYWIQHKQLELF